MLPLFGFQYEDARRKRGTTRIRVSLKNERDSYGKNNITE